MSQIDWLGMAGVLWLPLLLTAVVSYFLGCFNGAVIVSKYILRDDVRNHGSGNAGLTNFHRTFGGPLTFVVIACDALKAVVALVLGVLIFSTLTGSFFPPILAKYWAALFCLLWMFGGNTVSNADPREVADAVIETIDMENMLEADNQLIKRFYGLDPSSYESCILYYPTTNMMAEELLIVKLSDMGQQEAVRSVVEARIATQKTTFEGYGVEQFEMLSNNAVIEVRGNYILFVVNADSAAAQKAFLGAI